MKEQSSGMPVESLSQQFIANAHDNDASPVQMADAAADMAEAAIKDASPEERAAVAEHISRRIAPLIFAEGVDKETAIIDHKIARMEALGLDVNAERIRKVIGIRRIRNL